VDLSQSASFITNTGSHGYYSSHCSVSSLTNACDASSFSSKNLISNSGSHSSLTFPAVYASNLDGPILSVSSLAHGAAGRIFNVPNSSVYRNRFTHDVPYSAVACSVNYDAVVKSDPLSYKKLLAGNSGCDNDSCPQYPKTKKQKAVDNKTLRAEVTTLSSTNLLPLPTVDARVAEYKALTFGEIQEQLITKVVESGSLSGVFSDEQQHIVSTDYHRTTGSLAGSLPIGQFSSPVQNRVSLSTEMASSECRNLHSTGSSLKMSTLFPQALQSFTTSTQGLWF